MDNKILMDEYWRIRNEYERKVATDGFVSFCRIIYKNKYIFRLHLKIPERIQSKCHLPSK